MGLVMWDWQPYLVEGGTRPDAISGLQDPFEQAMAAMFAAAPPEIRNELRIGSGYRSNERQAQLWEDALAKYGDPATARKWVAPPGSSQHNHGNAADLKFMSPAAQEWVHANAEKFGLAFPLSNEPWHIEAAGARDGSSGGGAADPNASQPGNLLAQYGQTDGQPIEPPQWRNSLRLDQFMSAPRTNVFMPFGVS